MPAPIKWADGNDWHYNKMFGEPDLIIKSPKYTEKGGAMDAWYKPVVDVPLTEARWVRAIEMRPGTIKGRKITHHALAYLLQDDREAIKQGLISADTYIWKEGMADWQTLSEVKAVADALHAAARPAPAAAVRRNDLGAAPDLFGRIASAGAEDDITTSAPQPTFSAGTGARNESSVLFSLSALTGSGARNRAPSPGATTYEGRARPAARRAVNGPSPMPTRT